MPLWYYDKKDLKNTPSFREGIDAEIEARYRREGARFIIDCGTKLGLRYDTCATGVVFFHRFYMFHSFREFHRYVTAACCLFLAGKTEETPKKCKDIIKTTRNMLNDAQFVVFGDDPKEEVMTMERILLQTIKFDLLVEHPYAYLMKFAKMIKSKNESGDKGKVHKLVQMAWTFINDSLCTMLCLQWEPEVIAVSLMYLASRLTKTDITDWQGKPTTFKGKWWEYLVDDINLELLEDVCHQVLDLYSTAPKKRDDTPPPPPPKTPHPSTLGTPGSTKRPRSPSAAESHRSHGHGSGPPQTKMARDDKRPPSPPSASKDRERLHSKQLSRSSSTTSKTSRQSSSHSTHGSSNPNTPAPPPTQQQVAPVTTAFSQANPYVSTQMYSSSFMSQEGSQSIQSLVGGRPGGPGTYTAPPQYPPNPAVTQPTTAATSYTASYTPQQPPPPPQQPAQQYQHPPPAGAPPPSYPQQPVYPQTSQPKYTQPPSYSQQYSYPAGQYPATQTSYPPPTATYTQSYPQTQQQPYSTQPAQQSYPPTAQYPGYPPPSANYQNFAPTQSYQAPQSSQPPPQAAGKPPHPPPPQSNSGLGIRITSRQ